MSIAPAGVKLFALQYVGSAEVLDPKALREEIARGLEEAAKISLLKSARLVQTPDADRRVYLLAGPDAEQLFLAAACIGTWRRMKKRIGRVLRRGGR